jgi:hypothetical protein
MKFGVIYLQLSLVIKKMIRFYFFTFSRHTSVPIVSSFERPCVLLSHLSTLAAALMDSAVEPDADEMQAETERSDEEAAIPIGFGGRGCVSPVLHVGLGRTLPGGTALARARCGVGLDADKGTSAGASVLGAVGAGLGAAGRGLGTAWAPARARTWVPWC